MESAEAGIEVNHFIILKDPTMIEDYGEGII
jgi:hypothetical protein